MSAPVTLEIDRGLAVLTFNNPTRGNALDMAMATAFAASIEQIAEDSSVFAPYSLPRMANNFAWVGMCIAWLMRRVL